MYTPNPPSISVSKPDLGFEGFGDLFTCIRNKNVPLQNMHFVTYRNNLNKIWPLLISGISLGKWGCTKGMVLSISMYINSQKGQKVIWTTEGLSQRLFLDLEKIYFPPEQ